MVVLRFSTHFVDLKDECARVTAYRVAYRLQPQHSIKHVLDMASMNIVSNVSAILYPDQGTDIQSFILKILPSPPSPPSPSPTPFPPPPSLPPGPFPPPPSLPPTPTPTPTPQPTPKSTTTSTPTQGKLVYGRPHLVHLKRPDELSQ